MKNAGTVIKADYRKAELEAERLIRRFGLEEPPIDPIWIAKQLGINVRFVQFRGTSDERVSGYYNFEEKEIVVNTHEFPPRQTFTVAHELGHCILHAEWVKTDSYQVLLRDPTATEKTPVEQEANAFAANLLMPREIMNDYYRLSEEKIARLFAVSVPAVRSRLSFLYGF